jgi:hypothetical protein
MYYNLSATLSRDRLGSEVGPVVKKKEREYMGMFEIKSDSINVMIKHLTGRVFIYFC